MNKPIIAISGISGAGKTTIGRIIAKKIGAVYIDEDWFFKKEKPLIHLSNGSVVRNYDTDEAIDIVRMNQTIRDKLSLGIPIIIAGFALKDYFFDQDTKPTLHFHIKIPKEISLETRLKVKKFSLYARKNEYYMFNEIVYPYYLESLKVSKINYFIDGMNQQHKRRKLSDMILEISNIIKKDLDLNF
jgi:adenylate kinase family enzyme